MDSEASSIPEGLAQNRSRRVKKDKTGRLAALQRLKESKSSGSRIKYEVKDIENVYDEVNDDVYSDKVKQRLDDDWIIDDGAGDYVEDGREIFDEEIEDPKTKKRSGKSQEKTTSKNKNKIIKSSDIKQMLISSGAKKKTEKNINLENDLLLGDILQEINSSDPLSKPRSSVVIRKKKSLRTPPVHDFLSSSSPSINSDVITSPPSSAPGRKMKPRKIVAPCPIVNDETIETSTHSIVSTPPSKRSRLLIKDEDSLSTLAKEPLCDVDAAMQIDVDVEEFENDFDLPAPKKSKTDFVSSKSSSGAFIEQLTSLGWETNREGSTKVNESDFVFDSTHLPMVKNDAGDEVFRFYWLDAYEDQYKQPGVVYMFGKTYAHSAKQYVSCCVVVKNIDRKIFLLPREKTLKSHEDVNPQDVYHEFNNDVADKNKIMKFKTKIVEKKFVFGEKDIPQASQYLEITYPAEYGQLACDLSGDTFQCVFGANQSPLESLLLERKIKGPCWIDIKNPQPNSASVSWCKLDLCAPSPADLFVVNLDEMPPVVILSLSMKTVPNLKTHQNEVVGISGLIHDSFPLDKTAPKPAFKKSFFILSKPTDCVFPFDIREATKKRGFDVEIMGTERALLCSFLVKLLKIDPDVIIGHDVLNFDLDVLLHRFSACKVPHWSKLGRLRKLNMPKLLGGGRFSDRSITCGRLLCDIKISAKELIRCRSYDLATLSEFVLKKQRKEVPSEQIKNLFTTSNSLLWMVEHTLMDASIILDVACELNALPLALQITNIAGNVLSRTLLGGRSERNEFLLLHAFHEKDFIPPDKIYKKKEKSESSHDEGTEGRAGKARKKAAYAGGLVLDPKRGFYDKYILLLDFNSLYPSIIQEYNICFTTITRYPDDSTQKIDMDSYIPELPDSGLDMGVLPTEIRKLVQRRKQVKQLMKTQGLAKEKYIQYDIRQKALKLTANSMYGCLGFSNSRFYAKPIAALVTRQGREILMHTKELAQKMGLDVIYGDTDSIMINTNSTDMDHAFKLGHQVKAEVNKLYRLLEIDIDGVYKSLLLLKKKKYAALSVQMRHDGTYSTTKELKGLDIVRRDWCDLAKVAGNYAVDQILSELSREDIVDKIHQSLADIGNKVRSGEFPTEKFEIRKELTRDPSLYPGKDSLPHVRVALRVNNSMSKRMKSGDIVSYVVCQDGTTNPATHRAYSVEELTNQAQLTIDCDYYLSQQVHPVVTRLCDPIDGTDAARIAQCLGLDPSGFKQAQPQGVDEEERMMSVLATEEEKFSSCQKLVFVCPGTGEEIILDRGVFTEAGPHWTCSLETPCGDGIQLSKFVNQLQNQVSNMIRKDILKYYQCWVQCDDPACNYRTRFMSSILDRSGVICTTCFKGLLRPEVTAKALYQQLSYYKMQFDVEYALTKYKQDSTSSKANIKLSDYRKLYKSLYDVVDRYLSVSGYNEISLSALFQGICSAKTK